MFSEQSFLSDSSIENKALIGPSVSSRYDSHSHRRKRSSLGTGLRSFCFDDPCQSTSSSFCQAQQGDRFIAYPDEYLTPLTFKNDLECIANCVIPYRKKRINCRPLQTPISTHMSLLRKHFSHRLLYPKPTRNLASATINSKRLPSLMLDAPSCPDDFYAFPISWSSAGNVAFSTNHGTYLLDMTSGQPNGKPRRLNWSHRRLSSDVTPIVEWSPDSSRLAYVSGYGLISVYRVGSSRWLSELLSVGDDTVSCMHWRDPNVLSVGTWDGILTHYDMRSTGPVAFMKPVGSINGSGGRLTGLRWNSDGTYLATGRNSGEVAFWDARACKDVKLLCHPSDWKKRPSSSAVKAITWCPWKSDTFATGGGSQDGMIRIWSTRIAEETHSWSSHAQVTSLHFAPHCKELVSTQGFLCKPLPSQPPPDLSLRPCSILVHSFPSARLLIGKTDMNQRRITSSCLSPDGTRLMTCSADETIKVWDIFGPPMKLTPATNGLTRLIR